jgi:hypothetical protein
MCRSGCLHLILCPPWCFPPAAIQKVHNHRCQLDWRSRHQVILVLFWLNHAKNHTTICS